MAGGEFICAGFGSMKAGDATRRGHAITDAARSHGVNVLIVTGWGGLDIPGTAGGPRDIRAEWRCQSSLPEAAIVCCGAESREAWSARTDECADHPWRPPRVFLLGTDLPCALSHPLSLKPPGW